MGICLYFFILFFFSELLAERGSCNLSTCVWIGLIRVEFDARSHIFGCLFHALHFTYFSLIHRPEILQM